jgi:foldase protein PrsA
MEPGEVSQPVYDPDVLKNSGFWILKVAEKDGPDNVRVYGILLGDKSEAEEIKARLEAGEDFNRLVKQYSQDENSKQDDGDLGWQRKGYASTIMEPVFDLEIGQLSDPVHDITVQTRGGYWIIEVIEKESDKPLDEEMRTRLLNEDMMNWLMGETESSDIENYLTDTQQKWAIQKVVSEIDIRGK